MIENVNQYENWEIIKNTIENVKDKKDIQTQVLLLLAQPPLPAQ